jgi:hypothetical protein
VKDHRDNHTAAAPTTATAHHQPVKSRSRTKRLRLPSPSMIVALGALVMSVGGNVTAAALLTSAGIKDNTIRTVDVRDGTLRSRDVTNGTLTRADIRDGTLKGVDVANNSLTGADISESSLGNVPSAQNAGTVDGLDASSLTRVARMDNTDTLLLTVSEKTYGPALSITAPAAGFVMVHGSTTIKNSGCTTGCATWARIAHVQKNGVSGYAVGSIAAGQFYENISNAWVFPVNAGVNTFTIGIGRASGDGVLNAWSCQLAAIYSPFGSTGAGTL